MENRKDSGVSLDAGDDDQSSWDSTDKKEESQNMKFIIGCSDEDFDDNIDENEVVQVVPPDGGWGWVVVICAFLCNAIVDGIILTSGMLYPKLKHSFDATNTEVAWISSLLGGFYLLTGPLVAALANTYGFRFVTIFGSILSCMACILSFFATNIYFLYVSFGIIGGIGFGFIYMPAVIIPGFYFEKRRALATGIALCGSGIGTFIMSPLNAFLFTYFGDNWRYIFLVYAGLLLACGVCGLAFLPITPTTGKVIREEDDGLQVIGTPLLIRIKRARDLELAQCPSALSMTSGMTSGYSRTSSKVTIDEHSIAPGDFRPLSMAKALLDRHGLSSRFSYPGIVITAPEPIIEEVEYSQTDSDSDKEINKNDAGNQKTIVPKEENVKTILDNNKNETTNNLEVKENYSNGYIIHNQMPENESHVLIKENLEHQRNQCPRNLSAPAFHIYNHNMKNELKRRNSRSNSRSVSYKSRISSRPFCRDDIFYSGSLARIPQYQQSCSVSQYLASVTHIPECEAMEKSPSSFPCTNPSFEAVIAQIFDFRLLKSITFTILSIAGFFSLLSLFIPFNFLPSFAEKQGIEPTNISFLMSLLGICNTVGRIVCGWISDHPKVDALAVNCLALIVGGVATIILPCLSDLSVLYCYAVVFGLGVAAFASLRSILLVELLGIENLTNAFGLLLLFQGIAALIGSPVAGWFVDVTSEYKISFYTFGSIFMISGIVCIPLRVIKKWEDDRLDEKMRREKYGL